MKLTLFTRYLSFTVLTLLAGCSSHTVLPDFTASGYLADRGGVRIWRKNHHKQVEHLMTVFTPFKRAATETSDYVWRDGKLVSVKRHISGEQPEEVTLRFGHDGSLSFMQRQLVGGREALSSDAIALYQFDAQRMLEISDDLLKGRVVLLQGYWSPDGRVTTCQGKTLTPVFDSAEQQQIARQQHTAAPLSVAWLEVPGDTQLLLVTADDLCNTEPNAADF